MAECKLTTLTVQMLSVMWERGARVQDLADSVGLNQSYVTHFIGNHRDLFPRRNHREDWWREQLEKYRHLNCTQAAKKIGTTTSTVSHWRKRLGM